MSQNSSYRELLKNEWELRISRNPAYSLRAYARDLKLTPPQLSEILSAKRGLSRQKAMMITAKLNWSPALSARFCDLVDFEHARSATARTLAKHRLDTTPPAENALRLSADSFRTVADWYHFAILAALRLEQVQGKASEVAKRLKLPSDTVIEALQRLSRLGLVENKNKLWVLLKDSAFSPDGIPSEAIKHAHDQLLKRASDALFHHPLSERDFFSYITPLAGSDLPEITKRYRKFVLEIRNEFGNKPNVDRVVNLGSQIFSLSVNPKIVSGEEATS